MRKMLFGLLMTFFCLNVNAVYFGVPQQLDVSTWALAYPGNVNCSFQGCGGTWPSNPSSLAPYSYMNRDTFVYYLKKDVKSQYPNLPTTWFRHYEDGTASLESFNSSTTGLVAVVLFTGHGTEFLDQNNNFLGGNAPLFMSSSTTCEVSNTACMSFPATGENLTIGGNQTKWAFLDCCLGLYDQNPNNYQHMFNGVHGIYGFQSNGYDWGIGPYPNPPHYSYCSDRFKYLWANWLNGQDLWTSYSNAITQNYTDANQLSPGYIPGWAFAVVFPFGHAYDNNGSWAYINGAQEVITNVFHQEMPMNTSGTDWYPQGMLMWVTSLGNPQY